MSDDTVGRLLREVIEVLKRRFVGRDEVIDLIALAVTAGAPRSHGKARKPVRAPRRPKHG